MKKINTIIYTLLIILLSTGQLYAQKIINGLSMPESVVSDGKRFFVSNQGQDVFSKDGDGFITEISVDGKIITYKFAPLDGVLNAPKGMVILNNILYVADIERIVGFDLNTRKTVFNLTVPNAGLLNDLYRLSDSLIGVTDTQTGNIYSINTKTSTLEILGNVPYANGINYNPKNDLLVVCTNGAHYGDGEIVSKKLSDKTASFTPLPNISNGFFDGIEFVNDSTLLISDWVTFPVKGFGKLWLYDLNTMTSEMILTTESPADIYYDKHTNKIYIPQMLHNRVIITDLEHAHGDDCLVKYNQLYQYGIAQAFVGGMYEGSLPVSDLKLKGNFGLGAPDMLDGELTMNGGKMFQTKATGETSEVADNHKTALAFITFFKADKVFYVNETTAQRDLFVKIGEYLENKNGMYAIRITGQFDEVEARAFPPVKELPYAPLASMLDKQKLFNYANTQGVLIGYHLPNYINGINFEGFHFHFLSDDYSQGGHVLNFKAQRLKIEISELNNFTLDIPTNEIFKTFDFKNINKTDLQKVEKGRD